MREEDLHRNVCDYLRLQYPSVLFHTDFAAGVRLTMGQAVKNKRLQAGRAWPDLFIAEPMDRMEIRDREKVRVFYHGLFIELKTEGTKLYLKDDVTMVANPHYQEQAAILKFLEKKGYKAVFCCGFDECRKVIDKYLADA